MAKSSGVAVERRRFERYHLPSGLARGALARLRIGEGCQLPILNLSYGGILCSGGSADLRFVDEALAATPGQPLVGEIGFLFANSLSITVNLARVLTGEGTVSFSLIHDKPDVLLFLRPWLECFRQAATLARLDSAIIQADLRDNGWMVWRGDGPVTLSMKFIAPDAPQPSDWRLVLRRDESYVEVGGTVDSVGSKVYTRESVDIDGRPAGRMAPSGQVDSGATDLAIAHLAGFATDDRFTDEIRISLIDRLRSVSVE